jgi:hypothetical protein
MTIRIWDQRFQRREAMNGFFRACCPEGAAVWGDLEPFASCAQLREGRCSSGMGQRASTLCASRILNAMIAEFVSLNSPRVGAQSLSRNQDGFRFRAGTRFRHLVTDVRFRADFIHDRPDRAYATAAGGAASQAPVDLAGSANGVCGGDGPDLMIRNHIARTHDHDTHSRPAWDTRPAASRGIAGVFQASFGTRIVPFRDAALQVQ